MECSTPDTFQQAFVDYVAEQEAADPYLPEVLDWLFTDHGATDELMEGTPFRLGGRLWERVCDSAHQHIERLCWAEERDGRWGGPYHDTFGEPGAPVIYCAECEAWIDEAGAAADLQRWAVEERAESEAALLRGDAWVGDDA
jgi:hypothetical protein